MHQTATAQKQAQEKQQHTVVNLTDAFQIAAFYAPMQQACPQALKERSQADFEAHLDAGHAVFGVLDASGTIIGMNMVAVADAKDFSAEKRNAYAVTGFSKVAFVEGCAVKVAGQGIGPALLGHAIAHARTKGAKTIHARVETAQAASMRMFQKAGFTDCADVSHEGTRQVHRLALGL